MEDIFLNKTQSGMCKKIIMTSFNPSRIKYLVQELILYNKNIRIYLDMKQSNYKQSINLSVIF